MPEAITMYSTTWCGYCRRLKTQLDEAGIPVRVVDVDATSVHDAKIAAATGGFRTVPTLEIGGRLLVNPSLREVEEAIGPAPQGPSN